LAQHCPDCPRFAGEYDSFDAMLAATNGAMPGAGVQCNGNCILPGMEVLGEFEACLKSLYSGPAREVLTSSGNRLSVTANHPILTLRGWIPANLIRKGDYAVSYSIEVPVQTMVHKDYQYRPSHVEDVFEAILSSGGGTGRRIIRARSASSNFHGDAQWSNGQVDIVAVNWKLLANIQSFGSEGYSKLIFEPTSLEKSFIGCSGSCEFGFCGISLASSGLPCIDQLPFNHDRVLFDSLPLKHFCFGTPPNLDAVLHETAPESIARNSLAVAQLLHRHAGTIFADEIVEITDFQYFGHVYDLQTSSGTILAQNIVTSNCRCHLEYIVNGEWTGP